MAKVDKKEFLNFFIEQFKQKSNGEYKRIMVYPNRGEVYALKSFKKEVSDNEIVWVYVLNQKERDFFREHKEYCNKWIYLIEDKQEQK